MDARVLASVALVLPLSACLGGPTVRIVECHWDDAYDIEVRIERPPIQEEGRVTDSVHGMNVWVLLRNESLAAGTANNQGCVRFTLPAYREYSVTAARMEDNGCRSSGAESFTHEDGYPVSPRPIHVYVYVTCDGPVPSPRNR